MNIFEKIIAGEIPAEKLYEDDLVIAINDIAPAAPVHILIIPKENITSVAEIDKSNSAVIARVFEVARRLAEEFHLENGYRIITNVGADGGQTVPHLHFHLLGGKKLGEKLV